MKYVSRKLKFSKLKKITIEIFLRIFYWTFQSFQTFYYFFIDQWKLELNFEIHIYYVPLIFFTYFTKSNHKRALYLLHSEYLPSTLNIRHSAVYSVNTKEHCLFLSSEKGKIQNYYKNNFAAFWKVISKLTKRNNIKSGILQSIPVYSCLFLFRNVQDASIQERSANPETKEKCGSWNWRC